MKPKNKKAFRALIKKYESIKLEDIPHFNHLTANEVKRELTGFGSSLDCTLCKSIGRLLLDDCNRCVWAANTDENVACVTGVNGVTYDAILNAETPEELIQAYRARAEHMKQVLKSLNKPTTGKDNGLHLGVVIIDEAKNLNE